MKPCHRQVERSLGRSAGIVLSLLLAVSVSASVPTANSLAAGKQVRQARVLGNKAVMHVYSYAPETREITSVTSRFFKDVDACESAVAGALSTATSRASEGDLVDVQCVSIDLPESDPPEATEPSEETHRPADVTAL